MPLALAALTVACTTVPPATSPPVADEERRAPAEPSMRVTQPPASPEEIRILRELVDAQDRLYRVAAPLLTNNAELCRKHARDLLGFRAKNRHSYSDELVRAAETALGLDDRLQVTGVLPESGAAKAGIQLGDVLLSVNDYAFPTGDKAEREAAALLGPLVAQRSTLKLVVQRSDQPVSLEVPLTQACAFNIEVGNAGLVNAYGDGYRVLVTRGMMQAVRDDDELAFVIAKEMAHNVLGHAARMNQQATMGGIIDNLVRLQPDLSTMPGMAGLRPVRPEFDVAADRLSLYLLAHAGYKLDKVVPFWRRMAAEYPPSMQNAYTALHPETERRIQSMQQAVRDIRARRANGRPLIPAP